MARILIAEDERDIRELITYTLMFAGHEVFPTANGEEAWPEMSKRDVATRLAARIADAVGKRAA